MSLVHISAVRPRPSRVIETDIRRRVLVVEGFGARGRHQAQSDDLVVHSRIRNLSRKFLRKFSPDIVAAPLITDEWDIVDLARALANGGYRGVVQIHAGPVPRADLIIGELRDLFPDLEMSFADAA